MLYCISHFKKDRNAGAKAPADISRIAKEIGAIEIPFQTSKMYKSVYLTRFLSISVGRQNWKNLIKTVEPGSWIIVQHPNENIYMANRYIDVCRKIKDCHFIALIHDLNSIRKSLMAGEDPLTRRNQLADDVLLKKFDYLICHNDSMKEYLVEHGFDGNRIIVLGIFDYLHDCELPQMRTKEKRVVIAGNLIKNKCEYLYKLMDMKQIPFTLDLFGSGFSLKETPNFVKYHGSCLPDELPGKLEGAFGLVWDGTEIDCCAGNAGEYIRYNNPHKCSLFLASNMPVIIWKEAALAKFVEENGVGISVDSLLDIGDAIDALSELDYRRMVDNTKKISALLRSGYYFTSAMESLKKKENHP